MKDSKRRIPYEVSKHFIIPSFRFRFITFQFQHSLSLFSFFLFFILSSLDELRSRAGEWQVSCRVSRDIVIRAQRRRLFVGGVSSLGGLRVISGPNQAAISGGKAGSGQT